MSHSYDSRTPIRKHVPDSDPGSAPVPRYGMAGGPLGSAWGVAESAVPIRCTKGFSYLGVPAAE